MKRISTCPQRTPVAIQIMSVCWTHEHFFLPVFWHIRSNSPALTSISSHSIIPDSFERWHVFKWIVISSWHSRNLHTVSEPRKPSQLDFPKPEKENFTVSVAMLPLVCLVSSPVGLGMKYKVTHISTLIWTGLNRLVSDSSRFICKEKCFICSRNFPAMSWRVISMNKIASN